MHPDLITVTIADDHAVVRAGLRAVLSRAPDMQVVGEASGGREAVAMAERLRPVVAVMDLDMPDMDGATATREIVAKALPTRVLVLTMHAEDEYLSPTLQAGAAGYLAKNAADRELVDAVRTVAYGDTYLQPSATRALVKHMTRRAAMASEEKRFQLLSEREQTVLRLVAHGYSGPEIGDRLAISPKTVETYKQRINEKLGFTHRAEYIQFAVKLGFFEP
jgi:DNA-binding NarL/FixJ family response regulator